MIFAVEVAVTLKPVVNDPQGLVVRDGLRQLGFAQVRSARVGKVIALELEAASEQEARDAVVQMCEKLLRNPVIEDYRVSLGADAPGGGSPPTPASAAGVRPDASVPEVSLGADAPGGGSPPTPASAAGVRPEASVPPVRRTLRDEPF